MLKIVLLFIFTKNNIQIKEKIHVPVTILFPDYAFNGRMYMIEIHRWNVFLIILFPMADTEI